MIYKYSTPYAAVMLLASVTLFSVSAHSEQVGDPRKGAALFASHCSECHSMKEGKNKKGSSLYQVAGKTAAQTQGFVYSDALKESRLVWSNENLHRYLQNPKATVVGGKMKYEGMQSSTDRDDVISYLSASAH
jgi:cytochrome c